MSEPELTEAEFYEWIKPLFEKKQRPIYIDMKESYRLSKEIPMDIVYDAGYTFDGKTWRREL